MVLSWSLSASPCWSGWAQARPKAADAFCLWIFTCAAGTPPLGAAGGDPGLPSSMNQYGRQRALGGRAWTLWARAPSAGQGRKTGKGARGIWTLREVRVTSSSSAFWFSFCPSAWELPGPPPAPSTTPPPVVRLLGLAAVSSACTQELEAAGRWPLALAWPPGPPPAQDCDTGSFQFPSSEAPLSHGGPLTWS